VEEDQFLIRFYGDCGSEGNFDSQFDPTFSELPDSQHVWSHDSTLKLPWELNLQQRLTIGGPTVSKRRWQSMLEQRELSH
ncbi:hypothetical protein Ancab_017103, partial [Ancistrocladus abbreviatus]